MAEEARYSEERIVQLKGTTNGIKIAIVPQLEPVANAIVPESKKTKVGRSSGVSRSLNKEVKNSTIPISSSTADSPQAKMRITIVGKINFIPANQALTVSDKVKMPWEIDNIAAAISANRDPHNRDVAESAYQ